MFITGRFGSISRTTLRTEPVMDAGSVAVRTSKTPLASGRNVIALTGVLGIFADADDLDLVGFRGIESEAFADRILIREILVRERLIDDYYSGRTGVVVRPERASLEQRNAHRFKKVFTYNMAVTFTRFLDAAFRIGWSRQRFTQEHAARAGTLREQRQT